MENKYVLHYFQGNGRASNIRAILDCANVKYENAFIKFEEWPALKASGKFENGQVPVLEINGKQHTQTLAIETYLAKQFNLMGSNLEDEFEITNILCSREDFVKPLYEFIMPNEDQKKRREEIVKNLVENFLPRFAQKYENRYVANGAGKYFVGDKFSLADIYIATIFAQSFESPIMKDFAEIPAKHCPRLYEVYQRIKNAELKNYFENSFIKNSNF